MLQWQKSLQLTAWENMSLLLIWFIKITAETTLLQSYVPAINCMSTYFNYDEFVLDEHMVYEGHKFGFIY